MLLTNSISRQQSSDDYQIVEQLGTAFGWEPVRIVGRWRILYLTIPDFDKNWPAPGLLIVGIFYLDFVPVNSEAVPALALGFQFLI